MRTIEKGTGVEILDTPTPRTAHNKNTSEWNEAGETFGTNDIRTIFRSGDTLTS